MLRARDPDDAPVERTAPGRSWSARMAWLTLIGGGVLLAMRVSVATMVAVHGEGMAPTLHEGDYVIIVRERWTIEHGDVVVYDPDHALGPGQTFASPPHADSPSAPNADGREFPDPRRDPGVVYRNTAVVDREELEQNWAKVQSKTRVRTGPSTTMRLGRVLAIPGDRVEFHVPDATLGLAVEGERLESKAELRPDIVPAIAYEQADHRRYAVIPGEGRDDAWPGLELPPARGGPVQTEAEGYLIVADNRDEGSCCDSRALGWIPAEAIRGKVVLRLATHPGRAPEERRPPALLWNP